ncbi:sugar-binding transcriptional regulator [Virgibacillus necropolis]|nr:sugar-binding transcriptional regulator [Virgibacillus necropolis]
MKDERLIVKVAKLYYLEGWTQSQISKKVGLSRPIISKMIKEANENNIVEIYIKDETAHTVDLERILENEYGLNEVFVLAASDGNSELVRRNLGQVAATYLSKRLDDVNKIGISWGKSIHTLIEELRNQEKNHIHVTPLIGGMGQRYVHYHSNHLTFQLAEKLNTSSSYLYAPAIADTVELKNQLCETEDISKVLNEGRNVDIAVVGIGVPTKMNTMAELGYLSEQDILTLGDSGSIGDLNSNFFDIDGIEIDHPVNQRRIGLNLEDIKKIPEVIAIAEGVHKSGSLQVALKARYINTLFIDANTAEKLINSD